MAKRKVTAHQLGQILAKEFGRKDFKECESRDDILSKLFNTEDFRAPFSWHETFTIPESILVYSDLAFKKNSDLYNCLSDRSDEVALVVDAVLSSIDSLHFATIIPGNDVRGKVDEWLYMTRSYDMLIKTVDATSDCILVSKLKSFIRR